MKKAPPPPPPPPLYQSTVKVAANKTDQKHQQPQMNFNHSTVSNLALSTVKANNQPTEAPLTYKQLQDKQIKLHQSVFKAKQPQPQLPKHQKQTQPSQQIQVQQNRTPPKSNLPSLTAGAASNANTTANNSSTLASVQPIKQKIDRRLSTSINSITNSPSNGPNKSKKQASGLLSKSAVKQKSADSKATSGKKSFTSSSKSQLTSLTKALKRTYSQSSHHEALQRISTSKRPQANGNVNSIPAKVNKEWHAPETYMYDYSGPGAMTADQLEVVQCTQAFWFKEIPNLNLLTREQRLEIKRDNLRRQAYQYAQAQAFRSTASAKRRLMAVSKTLRKFKAERNK